MPRQPVAIDNDKLHAAVRRLGHEYVFSMRDDAIDLLPQAKLSKIAKNYLDVESLRTDDNMKTKASLLDDVKAFDAASRAGEYYESFMVDSKNCRHGRPVHPARESWPLGSSVFRCRRVA